MRIVVAGGTGLIGTALVRRLVAEGHEIDLLTRRLPVHAGLLPVGVRATVWDAKNVGSWSSVIDGADAVINLAGESIGSRRWTSSQKAKVVGSRVNATGAIVAAMKESPRPPATLINGSAIGFYGHVTSGDVIEEAPRGAGFLAVTTEQWEIEALRAREYGTRVVVLRTGLVLAPGGGALQRMLVPFRLCVGGTLGSGLQWVSWVHREDVVGAILHCLLTPGLSGPVNVVAPDPHTMKQFCAALGTTIRRPSWLPVPAFALRLALGEMSEVVLSGQRVVPLRLQQSGYRFRYPLLAGALSEVVGGKKMTPFKRFPPKATECRSHE